MASDERTEQFRAIFDAEDIFDRFVKNANSRSGETRLRRDDEPTGQIKNGKLVPIEPPKDVAAALPSRPVSDFAKTPLRSKQPIGLGPSVTVRADRPVPPDALRSSAETLSPERPSGAETVVADSGFAAALVAEASPPVAKLRVPPRVPLFPLGAPPAWDHEVTVKADSASIGLKPDADEDEGTRPDAPMPLAMARAFGPEGDEDWGGVGDDIEVDEECLTMPRTSPLSRPSSDPSLMTDSGQHVLLLTRVKKSSVLDADLLDALDSVDHGFDDDGAEPLDADALLMSSISQELAGVPSELSSAELSDVLHELSDELAGVAEEADAIEESGEVLSGASREFDDLSDSLLVGESSVADMPRIHHRAAFRRDASPDSLSLPSSQNMLLQAPSDLPPPLDVAPQLDSSDSYDLDSLDLDELDSDASSSALDVGLDSVAVPIDELDPTESADAVPVPSSSPAREEQAWESVVRTPGSVTARLEAERVVPDVDAAGERDVTYVGEGVENGQMPTRQLDTLLSDMAVLLRYGHEGQVQGRLDELRRVYPEDLLLMRRLAEFYVENDRDALALDPLFTLASALFERRNLEGMRQVLEQVLKLAPDNKRAFRLLGLLQHKSG
ncbi:MAG: tetratricopeptide repeat protein [Sandaracinaceae bacterium]